MRAFRRPVPFIIGLALTLTGAGCGQATGAASNGIPAASNSVTPGTLTPSTARAVVTQLWASRERALSTLDANQLPAVESGAARAVDAAYIRGALCKCEPKKSEHPLAAVIPLIPQGATDAFIAQVRTVNSLNEHPWYLIAVTRSDGQWSIELVTFGGYQAAAPMHRLTTAAGYIPRVTQADAKRMARLVMGTVRYLNQHENHSSVTDYGATLTVRDQLERGDGIFGLHLGNGKEFACYTMHQIDTYTLAGGLAQSDDRKQWGALLSPGSYSAVSVDRAESVCVVGSGRTTGPGALSFQYDTQVVRTNGTPLGT